MINLYSDANNSEDYTDWEGIRALFILWRAEAHRERAWDVIAEDVIYYGWHDEKGQHVGALHYDQDVDGGWALYGCPFSAPVMPTPDQPDAWNVIITPHDGESEPYRTTPRITFAQAVDVIDRAMARNIIHTYYRYEVVHADA